MANDTNVPFKLNLPSSLRVRLGDIAAKNGRSVTAEIVARLEKSFSEDDEYENALKNIEILCGRVDELEKMVLSHDRHLNPLRYEHQT